MTEPRRGDFIATFTGREFYPLDPRPAEVSIVDIAHALANQCRFTGHTNRFYSVAQHSVLVSLRCTPVNALWGLLHDASEAFLCDVARPVKKSGSMAPYRQAEAHVMQAIAQRFGLRLPQPAEVELHDTILLCAEARQLLPRADFTRWSHDVLGNGQEIVIEPWSPARAEELFLTQFCRLHAPGRLIRSGVACCRKPGRLLKSGPFVTGGLYRFVERYPSPAHAIPSYKLWANVEEILAANLFDTGAFGNHFDVRTIDEVPW